MLKEYKTSEIERIKAKEYYEKNKENNRQKAIERYYKNQEKNQQRALERYHNNKEALNQKHQEWKKNNPDKTKAYSKEYYIENQEVEKAKSKEYYQENIVKCHAQAKVYRKENAVAISIRGKTWREKNPELWKKIEAESKKKNFPRVFIRMYLEHPDDFKEFVLGNKTRNSDYHRLTVLEWRDVFGDNCECCNVSEDEKRLHIHHKIYRYPMLREDLMLLCPKCHKSQHKKNMEVMVILDGDKAPCLA